MVQQEAGWQPRRQRAGGRLVPPTDGHTQAFPTGLPGRPQQLLGGKCSSFHIVCSCQCTQLRSSPQITVPDQRGTAEDVFRFSLRPTAALWVHKQGWRRQGYLVSCAHTLPSPRQRSRWFSPAGRLCSPGLSLTSLQAASQFQHSWPPWCLGFTLGPAMGTHASNQRPALRVHRTGHRA